ncbi:MAG: SpoVA/SpoVAEb family sporulation membrane protein [Ruminococcaceae bacterium]|nr:SpoVA/SpoVAEb family sporulation membrane protein [Oscillospiraceae bacterium]
MLQNVNLCGKTIIIFTCVLCKLFAKFLGPILTQTEGFILGMGAKMFTIAGPVIVYGVSASVVYGFIYWICQMPSGG